MTFVEATRKLNNPSLSASDAATTLLSGRFCFFTPLNTPPATYAWNGIFNTIGQ
jgi:hypothetical protein